MGGGGGSVSGRGGVGIQVSLAGLGFVVQCFTCVVVALCRSPAAVSGGKVLLWSVKQVCGGCQTRCFVGQCM